MSAETAEPCRRGGCFGQSSSLAPVQHRLVYASSVLLRRKPAAEYSYQTRTTPSYRYIWNVSRIFIYNISQQTRHVAESQPNIMLSQQITHSTGLCSCPKGLRVTITTAIPTYGIWPLPWNFHIYAEFPEIPWKHGNSAEMAKFHDSAQNSAARGKLWALVITYTCYRESVHWLCTVYNCLFFS